ncbi:MAG: hypothetical protein K9N51_12640 [Candidatus Pacebacteria bacterium]|nr:hypothetical protein [Candidatus Paceibacterota bacterium]
MKKCCFRAMLIVTVFAGLFSPQASAAETNREVEVFQEDFEAFANGEDPSSVVEVKQSPLRYGEVVDGSYAIQHSFNEHCPVTPPLTDFTLTFRARKRWPAPVAAVMVDFRLDVAAEKGYRIYYRWGEKGYFRKRFTDSKWDRYRPYMTGTTRLALLDYTHRNNLEPILTRPFTSFGSPAGTNPILDEVAPDELDPMEETGRWQTFRIDVRGRTVRWTHNGRVQGELILPKDSTLGPGAVGFDTYGFRMGSALSLDDIRITTTDRLPPERRLFQRSFAIPRDLRAIHARLSHTVTATHLPDTWLSQIRAASPSNSGMIRINMQFDFPEIHGKGRDMAARTPYVRFEDLQGRPFFKHNIYRGILGSVVPGHRSGAAHMLQLMQRYPDRVPHYGVALRLTGPADATGPQSAVAFIDELPDEFNVVAGIDYSLDGGHIINGGPVEAIYTRSGDLLYAGLPLRGEERHIGIDSPVSSGLAARVPAGNRYRDAYLKRLLNDHYFLEGEPVTFTVTVRGGREARLPDSANWAVYDAFHRPMNSAGSATLVEDESESGHTLRKLGRHALRSLPIRLALKQPGVYWFRCGSGPLQREAAFSIIPSRQEPGDSAAARSGVPDIYGQLYPMQAWRQDYGHYVSGTHVKNADYAATVRALNVKAFMVSRPPPELLAHVDGMWRPGGLAGVEIPFAAYPSGGRLWLPRTARDLEVVQGFVNSSFYRPKPGDNVLTDPEADPLARWRTIVSRHLKPWVDYWSTVRTAKDAALRQVVDAHQPDLELAAYGPPLINTFQYGNLYCAKYYGWDYRLKQDARRLIDTWQMETYAHNFARPPESYTPSIALTKMSLPELGCRWEIYGAYASVADHRDEAGQPPHGFNWPGPRFMTHQVTELMLAPWYIKDGTFAQAGNTHIGPGLEKYTQAMFRGFVNGMRNARQAEAVAPVRCPVFLRSYEAAERDPSWGESKVTNASAETPAYAYLQARLAGLPGGVFADIGELTKLDASDCDMLVLPPLRGITAAQRGAIRTLHDQGVGLVTFDDCSGLEDLFGVRRLDTGRRIAFAARGPDDTLLAGLPRRITSGKVLHDEDVFYELDGAREILSGWDAANRRVAPVLTIHQAKGRPGAVFFTLGATDVGRREQPLSAASIEGEVISNLIRHGVRAALQRISRAPLRVTPPASVLAFHRTDGRIYAVVMDSSWPHVPTGRGPVTTTLRIEGPPAEVASLSDRRVIPLPASGKGNVYKIELEPDEVVPLLIERTSPGG